MPQSGPCRLRDRYEEDVGVGLLTIGVFARAAGLTPKALRLSDEVGVFQPGQRWIPSPGNGFTTRPRTCPADRPAASHRYAAGRHPRCLWPRARRGGRGDQHLTCCRSLPTRRRADAPPPSSSTTSSHTARNSPQPRLGRSIVCARCCSPAATPTERCPAAR